MQPLIKRAAHHRLNLFAETFSVLRTGVGLECFACLPDLNDSKMVQAPVLHQKLEPDVSRVLLAFGGKFL